MASRALVRVRELVMRTKTFRPYDQDSLLLMPPSLHDWVDPDGLAAFLNDLVDELDMGPFLAAHDEPRGMPPYHPRLMLKVLLYGYATGVTSSRRIEERLAADINFMFLAGQARPDHKTIAEFRRRHLAAFEGLFLDALRLCHAAGLAKLGRVAIDGTKLKANASRHKAMSYGRMAEREAALAAEVQAILDEAEAVDAAEDAQFGDARGDELPPELRRRETRLARIREAKAALEAEARERTGDPDAVPEAKAQRNFTDPESRIMHSKPDGWIYGYNTQIAVDDGHQVIVATTLSADATDTAALPALVDQIETNTGRRRRSSSPMPAMRRTTTSPISPSAASTPMSRPAATATARRLRSPRGVGSRPVSRVASGWLAAHDEAGSGRVSSAQGDRRAGLRPDQGGPRLSTVPPAGPGQGDRRVASRVRRPQPRQAVPGRPALSNYGFTGGSRTRSPARQNVRETMPPHVPVQIALPTAPIRRLVVTQPGAHPGGDYRRTLLDSGEWNRRRPRTNGAPSSRRASRHALPSPPVRASAIAAALQALLRAVPRGRRRVAQAVVRAVGAQPAAVQELH